MSTVNGLEKYGNLSDFPAVELLHEAAEKGLSGSFRFAAEPQKIAVYMDAGEVVFAASNLRAHRLLVKLVEWNFLTERDAAEFAGINEIELGAKLIAAGKITPIALEMSQTRQTAEIIAAACAWTKGEWHFSPLVRVREDLRVAVDLQNILPEAARRLSPEFVGGRLAQNRQDSLTLAPNAYPSFDLTSEEAFALSRFDGVQNAYELPAVLGFPDDKARHIAYMLWLGGLLRRFNYDTPFDDATVRQLLSARLKLKEKPVEVAAPAPVVAAPVVAAPVAPAPVVAEVPVEFTESSDADNERRAVAGYLERIETAQTHYHVLDVLNSAPAFEVKQNYLKFAKRFHPDKFHHSADTETHTRLQNAFSKLAQAYEVIKDDRSRELYDFKLGKEKTEGRSADVSLQTPEAIFKQGREEFDAGNYSQAIAFFTRAVHLAPQKAEYHAHFGQALSLIPKFRHQAESELQSAVRLDERHPEWRLMLAEFYLSNNLGKRAAAEINRVLNQDPNHARARQMLAQIG